MTRLLATILVLPMLLGVAATSAMSGEPVATGKALYNKYGCYACHGYAAAGASMTGPALAGRGFDTRYVASYVRAPKGVMPLYRKSMLPDTDLDRIADFIAHLPASKPASQVPSLARLEARMPPRVATPLKASAGMPPRIRFATNCAGCHGSAGEGGMGPPLLGKGNARSAAQIAAVIRNPPSGMPKLTPAPISDAEVLPLARYVEGLASGAH